MKLTQQLLSISEESAVAKSAQTQAELLKAHQKAKKISADQGVVQHVNKDKNTGRIYASDWYDDDETIASYNNGKLKQGPVKEASELNDVTIDDMEDKKEPGANKKADEMEVGDAVKIVGGVEHDGEKGTIERFGHEKKFVVVKFKDGSMNSFHSSDVEELLGGEEDEDDDDSYDEDPETFYVAFYDEDEHHSWIGKVTKADGGKWHEEKYQGKPDYRWGTSYMSYLKPQDVMNWIHKDYRRGMEIEGPFFTPAEAIEYAEHNWGSIKESVEMNEAKSFTDFDAWKQAVLTSYPQQAKKIKFKGRMEGGKDTISAEVPGEDRSYGVWDQDEEKGVVLSEGLGADAVALVKKLAKRKSVNEDSSAEYGVYRKETYIAKKNGGGFKKGDEIYVTSAMYAPEYRVRVNDDEGYDFPCDYKDLVACGAVSPKKKVTKAITEAAKDTIEAHGIKGMSRTPWRRTFKDEDAMIAWAEKFDAEIYGQRETDYAAQLKKEKGIKEGVVDAVKGFVKHRTNMAKANTRGWETFGKGMGAALRDRYEKDPKKKAENERLVKQSVRDSNRYRDFADGGKGFNSTKRTTAEKKWDDAIDKVKGTVQRTLYKATNKDHNTTWTQTGKSGKHMQNGEHTQEWQELDKNGKPTGQREWRNMAGEYVGEGAANDKLKAHAGALVKKLQGKQTDLTGAKCSDAKCKGHFKETSMNDDMDGKLHCDKCGKETQRYVAEAHGGAAMPRKGTVAYNIIMKRKEEENKPENIKKIEKLGNKDHMVGNAKVIHKDVEEGFSPFKPNARVKIISGPKDVVGKEGTIGEVVTTNGQKSYTVDYDHDFKSDKPNFGAKSVRLQPKDIKLIRDTKMKEAKDEQLEVVNKDYDTKKKVFFTGTYEECKEFMRTHKSLKMDLMYKESGRLASYKL